VARHEDVLTAVVVERFPGESAIESFQAQALDVSSDASGPVPVSVPAQASYQLDMATSIYAQTRRRSAARVMLL
jgi:hypothetical protein